MQTTLLKEIVSRIDAWKRCQQTGNVEWQEKHRIRLAELQTLLPSGSGIDCGTKIDLDKSTGEKLVLNVAYHHMNESGMYDGWTNHVITVTASLLFGFNLRISGRDRNGIKEYLNEIYNFALTEYIEEPLDVPETETKQMAS